MQMHKSNLKSALLGGGVVVAAIAAAAAAFFFLDSARPLAELGDEYRYDLAEYAAIDPSLVLYEPVGRPIPTGLSQSRTIAIAADGAIWLTGDKAVVVMDARGTVLRTVECDAAPLCVAFDEGGLVYVGLTDHIAVFDAEGEPIADWQKPAENTLITSLAVAGGYVFAADAANKVVLRYTPDGVVSLQMGQRNPDRNWPGFVIPSPYSFHLALAPDGLLRIVNPGRHWVEAWTVDGHREWHWGETSIRVEGFSGCCNPAALAILPNGHIITSEKGLIRVKEYDDQGHFLGVVAGPEQLGWVEPVRVHDRPENTQVRGFGVAVDAEGRVYVLDTVRNVIRVFEKKK